MNKTYYLFVSVATQQLPSVQQLWSFVRNAPLRIHNFKTVAMIRSSSSWQSHDSKNQLCYSKLLCISCDSMVLLLCSCFKLSMLSLIWLRWPSRNYSNSFLPTVLLFKVWLLELRELIEEYLLCFGVFFLRRKLLAMRLGSCCSSLHMSRSMIQFLRLTMRVLTSAWRLSLLAKKYSKCRSASAQYSGPSFNGETRNSRRFIQNLLYSTPLQHQESVFLQGKII